MATLEIKFDAGRVEQKFSEMQRRINQAEIEMPIVALDWQKDDMKRSFPAFSRVATGTVEMTIWPRSRTWKRGQARKGGVRKISARRHIVRGAGGKRPILRPVLFEMLRARMVKLMEGVLKWQ